MVAKCIAQTRLVTCASPAYREAHGRPRDPDELSGHACVAFACRGVGRARPVEIPAGREVRMVAIEPRIVSDNHFWNFEAAVRGFGVVRCLISPLGRARAGPASACARGLGGARAAAHLRDVSARFAIVRAGTRLRGLRGRALRGSRSVSAGRAPAKSRSEPMPAWRSEQLGRLSGAQGPRLTSPQTTRPHRSGGAACWIPASARMTTTRARRPPLSSP